MTQAEAIAECLAQKLVAVVGVSENRDKYGWKVYQNLQRRGYGVLAVNPNHQTINGDKCYASVGDLPAGVGLVVTVVPPLVTRRVVREGLAAGLKRFWMQPGSEDVEAVGAITAAGGVVVQDCIMMR